MASGIVKFFNDAKGYGFIQVEGGAPDVFVHAKQVERSGVIKLVQGLRVSFDIVTNNRNGKTEASNLRVL